MKVTTFTIDLAKKVFQVHGFDAQGVRVLIKRLRRAAFLRFFQLEATPCEVVMEACGSANHWGRALEALGYRVRLIPPQHVKPFVMGDKTDAHDCDAIYEASRRAKVRCVPVKTVAQQEWLALHGMRARLIKDRTALMNQARGYLAEFGQVAPRGDAALRKLLAGQLEEADGALTPLLRQLLAELRDEWRELDARVKRIEREMRERHKASEVTRRLARVPGIGMLTATAAHAKLGDGRQFRRAREASAWVGIVPREESSGERRRLGGITKRGDRYLRTLLIHGARAAVNAAQRKEDAQSCWIRALVARRGYNRAVVALANKNMRILWAMLVYGTEYRPAAV